MRGIVVKSMNFNSLKARGRKKDNVSSSVLGESREIEKVGIPTA